MPFKSEAQRKFMYAKHPAIARRWRKEYGPQKDLPAHKGERGNGYFTRERELRRRRLP